LPLLRSTHALTFALQSAARAGNVVVTATVAATGMAAADPKLCTVMMDNPFPVDVRVTYQGYSKISGSWATKPEPKLFALLTFPKEQRSAG
jgi:hypothetical protein